MATNIRRNNMIDYLIAVATFIIFFIISWIVVGLVVIILGKFSEWTDGKLPYTISDDNEEYEPNEGYTCTIIYVKEI
jgi:hypothetical protein